MAEDPIGIAGGLNLAAYVEGDSLNLNDPEGEIAPMLIGALIGGITSAVIQYATTGCIDWQQVAVGAAFGAVGRGLGGALQKLGQVRRAYNASNQAALAANPGMSSAQASAIRTANQISGQVSALVEHFSDVDVTKSQR